MVDGAERSRAWAGSAEPAGWRPPDLLVIGVQRAGTTWLHARLATDPRIWMTPVKELHYLDALHVPGHAAWAGPFRARGVAAARAAGPDPRTAAALHAIAQEPADDAWYGRIFACAPPAARAGESTPAYALLPAEGVAHLRRIAPAVRAIIVRRDPVDRAGSQLRHARIHGQRTGLATDPLPADLHARSDYAATLGRWRAGLGADRLHVTTFDRLLGDPASTLDGIARFLGLGAFAGERGPAGPLVNEAPGPTCPPALLAQLRAELASVYAPVRAEDPETVDGWLARNYG
ncbi:MAG: sulfotransferase [Chloroflexota bacterium]